MLQNLDKDMYHAPVACRQALLIDCTCPWACRAHAMLGWKWALLQDDAAIDTALARLHIVACSVIE